jgi:hypothetical protein
VTVRSVSIALGTAALSLSSLASAQAEGTPGGKDAADPAPAATAPAPPKADAGPDTVDALRTLLDERIDGGSPAFALLGVAASDVVRPENPKQLVVGILNGLDERGNFKSGVAFDFQPMRLLFGDRLQLDPYSRHFYSLKALLTRTEISAATAVGSGDDKSARASVGILWTPFTNRDPKGPGHRSDCLDRTGDAPAFDPNHPEASKPARDLWNKAVLACKKRYSLRPDKGYSIQLGFAPLFVSTTGKTGDFQAQGYVATFSASLGLSDLLFPSQARADLAANGDASKDPRRAMLAITTAFRKKELIPDPAIKDAFLQRDRWSLGARFEVGRVDAVNFGLEAVYQHASYFGSTSDSFATFVGTLDLRVGEKQWLGLSAGTSTGRARSGEKLFIGTRFRWALGSKSGSGLF